MSDKLPSVGEVVELLRGCIGSVDYPPDALLAAAISHLESQRWIPVTERMPDGDRWNLLAYVVDDQGDDDVREVRYWVNNDWAYADGRSIPSGYVTHWRQLPPPPVKEGGEG